MKNINYILFVGILVLFISCTTGDNTSEKSSTITTNVTLENTKGKTLYLVKMNPSSSAVHYSKTGSTASTASFDDEIANTIQRKDSFFAQTFQLSEIQTPLLSRSSRAAQSYNIGDSRTFYVIKNENASTKEWLTVNAVLRASGTHSNVWVSDDNWTDSDSNSTPDKLNKTNVEKLAEKFDFIYPRVTNVFGLENGGGENGNGGIDGDLKIQILLYDINYDYTPRQTSGIFGYFWAKDFLYYNEEYHSNECEMFYMDAFFTKNYENASYSTLAHEFQHMINYSVKIWNSDNRSKKCETWYTEMLSMLCEDMMQAHLEVSDKDAPVARLSYFNAGYCNNGFTEWNSNSYSYASIYAFGAYLVRNFGGIPLLTSIAKNIEINTESITKALQENGYPEETFDSVFLKFSEAVVYNSATDGTTLNRSVTNTLGNYEYSFKAIDLWSIRNGSRNGYGPKVYSPSEIITIRPYGFSLHSQSSWANISSDTFTVTVTQPSSSSIKLYWYLK